MTGGWVVLAGLLAGGAMVAAVPPSSTVRLARGADPVASRAGDGRAATAAGRGRSWSAAREAAVMPVPMILDLVAAALAGGAPPARAVRAVAAALQAADDPSGQRLAALAARWEAGSSPPPSPDRRDPLAALQGALDLAAATGLGPVALVRSGAQDERRRRAAGQIAQARRLGVLVLLPTGLCLLPAFFLLTVVPLVLGLLVP